MLLSSPDPVRDVGVVPDPVDQRPEDWNDFQKREKTNDVVQRVIDEVVGRGIVNLDCVIRADQWHFGEQQVGVDEKDDRVDVETRRTIEEASPKSLLRLALVKFKALGVSAGIMWVFGYNGIRN